MQYQAAVVVYILDAHVLCACHMTAAHILVCGCGLCHMSVLTCMSLQLLVGTY